MVKVWKKIWIEWIKLWKFWVQVKVWILDKGLDESFKAVVEI